MVAKKLSSMMRFVRAVGVVASGPVTSEALRSANREPTMAARIVRRSALSPQQYPLRPTKLVERAHRQGTTSEERSRTDMLGRRKSYLPTERQRTVRELRRTRYVTVPHLVSVTVPHL
jgi:hypothetical protein